MAGWDDFGGDWDWLTESLNAAGDAGEWFVDSVTGDIVSAADAQALADTDYDFGDLPLADSPVSRSTSDILRSREGSPTTWTPGTERFDWDAMADPSASIASAGGMDWAKLLGQGLKGLAGLGGKESPLAKLGAGADPGLVGSTSIPGLMTASVPQVGGVGGADFPRVNIGGGGVDIPRVDMGGGAMGNPGVSVPDQLGLGALPRIGGAEMQDSISAALSHLQADPGGRLGLQAAIDPGPAPRPFTPLAIPTAGPGGGGGAPPAPRMSGLQRLLLEWFG